MSKNVVDAAIACANDKQKFIGFIPSRRQIEFDGGYVNNWNTQDFNNYVNTRTKFALIERDHGGPLQGAKPDPGYDSFYSDCWHMDIVHIDPWKDADNFTRGVDLTIEYMRFCYNNNPNLKFEIGTEESIFAYSPDQLQWLIDRIMWEEPALFDNVLYAVIQSGTAIVGNKNVGIYKKDKLNKMLNVCKKFGLLSKEHNGDYLNISQVKSKFDLGLDAINIAPEFGAIETEVILEFIEKSGDEKLLIKFYDICYESFTWKKWLPKSYVPSRRLEVGYSTPDEMKELIRASGHYVFASPGFSLLFKSLKKQYPSIEAEISSRLSQKINSLLDLY